MKKYFKTNGRGLRAGASCSKYQPNEVVKTLSICQLHYQIHCYFLLEKCENLFHCKRFSNFPDKKYQRICNIYILDFNVTLTNNVVNFEQLAPGASCSKLTTSLVNVLLNFQT